MNFRRAVFISWFFFLLASGLAVQPVFAAPATDENLARIHWLGLKQISADTNAAHLMSVWQLPQTAALVSQTLDKLSRWPGGSVTNAASALLRPLLDDLVSSEFHLEIYAPTNSRFLLALRLPADRARLWQTNLAAAMEVLTGVHPVAAGHGWWLQQSHAPERIEFFNVGQWTLVGFGQDTNDDLLPEFADRIARSHAPAATNCWFEADLAPSRLADGFFSLSARRTGGEGWGEVGIINCLLSTINHLNLTIAGGSGDVLTRGTLDFSRPLPAPLPAWEIPTNFIHSPLTTFTAVRGLTSWLAALPAWQKLQLAPPDQAFCWAQVQAGGPFVTYFAAPLPGASNQLSQLAVRLAQHVNPWLATNGEGSFQWQAGLPGIVWNDVFIISPSLKPITVNQHDYVFGGLIPFVEGNPNPMPADILRAILGTTNLVYYHSELTGMRVEDDLFITQLFRVVFHKSQLPDKAAATLWLKNIEPLLNGSTTYVTQTNPQQLAFTRQSTIGFTALELHLLADWLESPQFPHGLHTFLAPPDK